MKLKELKKMIAEEYSAYKRSKRIKEQGMPELPPIDDMPVDPMAGMGDAPKLDVGPDDIDVSGEKESPEETLRAIFDMLKDFFEGGDKPKAPSAQKDDKDGDKKDDKGGDKKDDKGGDKKDDKKDDKEDDKKDDKEELKESRRLKRIINAKKRNKRNNVIQENMQHQALEPLV